MNIEDFEEGMEVRFKTLEELSETEGWDRENRLFRVGADHGATISDMRAICDEAFTPGTDVKMRVVRAYLLRDSSQKVCMKHLPDNGQVCTTWWWRHEYFKSLGPHIRKNGDRY